MISGSLDILTGNSEKTESCVQGYPSVVVVSADTNVYLNNSKLDPQGGWKGGEERHCSRGIWKKVMKSTNQSHKRYDPLR